MKKQNILLVDIHEPADVKLINAFEATGVKAEILNNAFESPSIPITNPYKELQQIPIVDLPISGKEARRLRRKKERKNKK